MRIKHCVKANEVAHLWAHKVQDEAWKPGKRFYFEGDTIYSYGRHFPIAKHTEVNGVKCIFLTTRKYSNTTAGHVSCVSRAIPETIPVVMVKHPDSTYTPEELEQFIAQDVKDIWDKIPRARDSKSTLLGRGAGRFIDRKSVV